MKSFDDLDVGIWHTYERIFGQPSRGRWIVIATIDGQRRGLRCRSKRRALAIARERNGIVRRYHRRNWQTPPTDKVKCGFIVISKAKP